MSAFDAVDGSWGKADISCSRTAHEARVVLKNHTRS